MHLQFVLLLCFLLNFSYFVEGQWLQSFMRLFDFGVPRSQNLIVEYDFIIIGAGSAGCVLANRLSENPNWNILLLEAGGDENTFMDIPVAVHLLQQSEINWGYNTEPDEHYCRGMINDRCNWPKGKVMGGSSVLNYMIYTRGNPRDYDNWEKKGNIGWSYKDVLPYFKKIETTQINDLPIEKAYRGTNGPVTVTTNYMKSLIAKLFIKAGMEIGLSLNDYEGSSQIGVSPIQSNLKHGMRQSTNKAYLTPIRNRPNLHIKTHALVTKLIIDENSHDVAVVKFTQRNKKFIVSAKKEVLVSAGSINSPQLLMLSGIGPEKHLKEFDIKPIVNLRVGYNLMDHVAPALNILCDLSTPYADDFTLRLLSSYLAIASDVSFSSPGGCESIMFYDSKHPNRSDGYPDIELFQAATSIINLPTISQNFGIKPEIYSRLSHEMNKNSRGSFTILPMVLRPKSRGRLMLKSDNPYKYPLLFPNYFQYSADIETFIKAVRLVQKILETDAMRSIGARLFLIQLPGCEEYAIDSDEYWECYARVFTFTVYHYSGTCKMGPTNDKTAVVDHRLRVYNITNLRVVDASIIPDIISGHPNGPTMMIAEKAADMIKEDWGFV